jgi:hypothetical protein
MNSAEDEVRVREIKRLLDRIQQLPLVPPPEPVANAGYQEWAPEQQLQTGGEGYAPVAAVNKPSSSLSPWVFVLATA